ncbi:39S ribosomal protein S30, mitochondrial [Hyla sarda]|uniref:39S ribosomal protein S30, mitochondrial n=1 Tax=Hyla sarda TaxID=327740 RepID=UPI0024C2A31C|nr:39S ribosomal protein S30, mitochondrial [Hyla sarda]
MCVARRQTIESPDWSSPCHLTSSCPLRARCERSRPWLPGRKMAGRRIFGKLRHNAELPAALLLPPEPPAAASSPYPPVVASMTSGSTASRRRRIEGHYSRVRAQTDVSAKLKLITGLQRLKYVVYPQTFAQNADRWYQHFTKTAYVPGLPGRSGGPVSLGEQEMSGLKSMLCEALLQELYYTTRGRTFLYRSQEVSAGPFLSRAMAILSSQCAQYNGLLRHSTLDVKPQVNFYWLRGETRVPRGHRKGCIDPIRFQIDDTPLVQIRVPEPLKEFVPLDFVVPEEVPVVPYEPSRLPLFPRQYDNNIFIGSKLDDPCSFGHTQFHLVPDKYKRERLEKLNQAHHTEVFLRANAIASLFAWTGAQAMYQGFWSQEDVTRPFVSQGVISDGKYFSFFCYQLNTLALAADADKDPNRKNICWGTESAPLYEAVEKDDIKGFNDEVFRKLVDFFLNSPA